ncbi:MsnO8 family LLM class oxidoreductase [[Mycoplasma] collis]|uniref:MsnO8 family LLM class oxidoreductase n=1 Tax=[Mycoplasma] collis TaxID=2127 RepID=UPI00051C0F24|nr:MsnO8 family LLM class oxidoreductase [[Mycoplasma] collis]
MKLKFSLMEYGIIDKNSNSEFALQNISKIAKIAEKYNFESIWFSEHHSVNAFALSNPAFAMLEVANKTKKIKIGSAGFLLCHHSSYKIAEDIFTLNSLHENRFKFAMGSNPGTEKVQKSMNTIVDYHNKFKQLLLYVRDKENKFINEVKTIPFSNKSPDMYMLVSSVEGAIFAAENKLKIIYGFFLNHNWEIFENALKKYNEIWKAKYNEKANILFAINIIIKKSENQAKNLANVFSHFILGKNEFNEFLHFPTLNEIKNYHYENDEEKTRVIDNLNKTIYGTETQVKEKILKIAQKYNINHFVACQLISGYNERVKNLKSINKVFEL